MTTLPGLNKGVFQDPSPPLVDSVLSPITIPNGTTLVTTKTTNETIVNVDELIDYVSGDNAPNFIPQSAIDTLVADLAAKEDAINKGAISGYAGLDASQELLLANFPLGAAFEVLKRNAGNTALEFGLITDANTDTFTTTKISTTDKSLLNSAIVYNDQANTYSGAGDQNFAGSALRNFGFIESSDLGVPTSGLIRLGIGEGLSYLDGATNPEFLYVGGGTFTLKVDETVGGPVLVFEQSNTSPLSSAHFIGGSIWTSFSSTSVSREFGGFFVDSLDNTDGAEEGTLSFQVIENGAKFQIYMSFNQTGQHTVDIFRELEMNNNKIIDIQGLAFQDIGGQILVADDVTGFNFVTTSDRPFRFTPNSTDILDIDDGGLTFLGSSKILNLAGNNIDNVGTLEFQTANIIINSDAGGMNLSLPDNTDTFDFVVDTVTSFKLEKFFAVWNETIQQYTTSGDPNSPPAGDVYVYAKTGLGGFVSIFQRQSDGTITDLATTEFADNVFRIFGSADTTKQLAFEVDGLTTATVRVMTVPDKDMTLAGTNDNLGAFAATTSAQLAGVINDETGSGLLVFGTSPTIVTPTITSFTNAQHNHQAAAGGGQLDSTLTLSDTANIAYLNTPNIFIAGNLNQFGHNATNTGLRVVPFAGNPSVQNDGEIWYNDSTDTLFGRINGADVDLGAGEANTISSIGGGTVLTAAVPKVGVDLQMVSIATTAPISNVSVSDLITFSLNPLVNADISATADIAVSKLADGNPGQFVRTDSAGTGVEFADDIASITFVIDGGGSVLATGVHGDLRIPFNCTIVRVTLLADQIGDVEIDLFVDTFPNYPPVVGDSIVAAAPPTITADDNFQDATLTDWTTGLASGSTIRYNVNSVTTIQRVTVELLVRKTG